MSTKRVMATVLLFATTIVGAAPLAAYATSPNPSGVEVSSVPADQTVPQADQNDPFAVDDTIPSLAIPWDSGRSVLRAATQKTISQLNTWVNDNVKHCFSNHGGTQCVALFNAYNEGFLGNDFVAVSSAYQLYDAAPSSKWTKLSASATPKKGDVAVWGTTVGGGHGHVALVLESMSSTTIRVFHQNWNGECAHKEEVSNNGVIGYLRPKNLS